MKTKTIPGKRPPREITAYCWADGTIKFTRSQVPEGALAIVKGPSYRVRQAVALAARHAYDGKTLIVAAVRDIHTGFTEGCKVEALKQFKARVSRLLA